MNERPTKPIRAGGKISANEFNRAASRNDRLTDFSGTGIGSSDEFGDISLHSTLPARTNIRIISGTNPYEWEEVVLNDDTLEWEPTGVRVGTETEYPAYERGGSETVEADTVHEAVFNVSPDGISRWLFSVSSGSGRTQFFPARIGCRRLFGDINAYAWTEYEWLSDVSLPTFKSGGRFGYPPLGATVTRLTVGTVSVPEVQFIAFCGQPLTEGTWAIGTASPLDYDIDAATLTTALNVDLGADTVTATGSMEDGWTITFSDPGAQSLFVVNLASLEPADPLVPACELRNRIVPEGTIVYMELISGGTAARFSTDYGICFGDDIPGYDSGATMNVLTLAEGGCMEAVQPEECDDAIVDGGDL